MKRSNHKARDRQRLAEIAQALRRELDSNPDIERAVRRVSQRLHTQQKICLRAMFLFGLVRPKVSQALNRA